MANTPNLDLNKPTINDDIGATIPNLASNFQKIDDSVGVINQTLTQKATVSTTKVNLIDESKVTTGFAPNITTGVLDSYVGYSTSDFIPVTVGKTYIQNEGSHKVFYNSAKVFISGVDAVSAVAPANAAYIRVAISNAYIPNQTILAEGTTLPPYQNYNDVRLSENVRPNKLVNPLLGLKWCVLGDSITQGYGFTPYAKYISDRTGIVVENYGLSGSTLSNGTGASNPMCIRYSGMSNDADIITVFGGTNDMGNNVPIGTWGDTVNTTIYGATKILVEGLITKYPTKRIGFILSTPRQGYTSPTSNLKNVNNAIKDVCDRYSIPTLDLYTGSGIAPDFTASKNALMPDGLHPNNDGQLLISRKIQSFIQRL